MDIGAALGKYFPEIRSLRDIQRPAIESLLAGRNTLCLMPTGVGKTLIFELAGLLSRKATVVISPLIALMKQQARRLERRGVSALSLGGTRAMQAYPALRDFEFGEEPGFLFVSPEKMAFDGYLEHWLKRNAERIGLVVVDEAHCVSQWGHSFRPTYTEIPACLDRCFGENDWPMVLCLTATINPKDKAEICRAFKIGDSGVLESPVMLRDNLDLSFSVLEKEEEKREQLREILAKHRDQKVIVYVHRKRTKHGTRAMAEEFAKEGLPCEPFDGDMDAMTRDAITGRFESGETKVVFATNAFGMGVDIPDIRAVVHYLIPESIEQYYQEVGRAGRDGERAHGYLLYSSTNLRIRRDMIRASFPNAEEVRGAFDRKFRQDRRLWRAMEPWSDFSDRGHERLIWHYLQKHEIVSVCGKGPSRLRCFGPVAGQSSTALERYTGVSRIGLLLAIAGKINIPVSGIATELYGDFSDGALKLERAPESVIFYASRAELGEDVLNEIIEEMKARRDYREAGFKKLIDLIESGQAPEDGIRAHLQPEEA